MIVLVECHEVEVQILNAVLFKKIVRFQQAAQVYIVQFSSLCQGQFVDAWVAELLADVQGLLVVRTSDWVAESVDFFH